MFLRVGKPRVPEVRKTEGARDVPCRAMSSCARNATSLSNWSWPSLSGRRWS